LDHGSKETWAEILANQWDCCDVIKGTHPRRPRKGHMCPIQQFSQKLLSLNISSSLHIASFTKNSKRTKMI